MSRVDTAVESVTVDDKIVTSDEKMNTSEEEYDETPDTLVPLVPVVQLTGAHSSWHNTQDTLHSPTNSKG